MPVNLETTIDNIQLLESTKSSDLSSSNPIVFFVNLLDSTITIVLYRLWKHWVYHKHHLRYCNSNWFGQSSDNLLKLLSTCLELGSLGDTFPWINTICFIFCQAISNPTNWFFGTRMNFYTNPSELKLV